MPAHASVTVYCSSSRNLHEGYHHAARAFATLLARSGRTLVFGGGRVGLMGEIARAARAAGGRTIGIITTRLRDAELLDPDNHENIVVPTMRERKALLESRGDAFVVLPGGPGTLEEFFEILVGRHLGEHSKPIHMLSTTAFGSTGRYYDPLLALCDHMVEGGFAPPHLRSYFRVHDDPAALIADLDTLLPREPHA
ncbi:MAG: TIGR00730 family Rossman fold protein [Planctomycetota bacterium]|nr:TIGR00730 family Rossman fold protein [Planctomycetota bacterium]